MNILLFGASNVGKTTIGKCLAEKLDYTFYDLDQEIQSKYNITLTEFVNGNSLQKRDKIRTDLIVKLLKKQENKVIAISPMSYLSGLRPYFKKYENDMKAIELIDKPKYILKRLVFTGPNGEILNVGKLVERFKDHYLHEIQEDLAWYHNVNQKYMTSFDMDGRNPQEVVDAMIETFQL